MELHWMKLFPGTLLLKAAGLSQAERCAYYEAVFHLWGERQLTEAQLSGRVGTLTETLKLRLDVAENGALHLRWLDAEREAQTRLSTKNSHNGSEGGRGKRKKVSGFTTGESTRLTTGKTTRKPTPASASLPASDAAPESEAASQGVQGGDDFEALWKTFEGKGAKSKAREYWQKLSESDRAAITSKAPAYCLANSGERYNFRKNLEGWINPAERRWEAPVVQPIAPVRNRPLTKEEGFAMMRQIKIDNGIPLDHGVPQELMTRELLDLMNR